MADVAKSRGFRVNDVVTVHGHIVGEGRPLPGRVICVNRKTRYMQPIVVLVDHDDSEMVECFCKDGTRYLQGHEMRLTLGKVGADGG